MDDKELEKQHRTELGFGDGYAWAQELAHDDELTWLSQINLGDIGDGEEAAFAVTPYEFASRSSRGCL